MAETRTGLDAWLGKSGAEYAQELVRQASRVTSELSEQPTNGIPRVVDIIRKTTVSLADTALGIAGSWQAVAGLQNLQATYFQPSKWDKELNGTSAETVDASRRLLIADVPEAGGTVADRILLTDKIRVDDPAFGVVDLKIKKISPMRGTGLIHVEAVYSRDRLT